MPLSSLRAACLAVSFVTLFAPAVLSQSYVFTTVAGASNLGAVDGPGASAKFSLPEAVALDSSGNIYVADFNNLLVRKIATDGTVSTLAGKAGVYGYVDDTGTAARFGSLFGITVAASGNVYVCDYSFHTIRRITPTGAVATLAGLPGQKGTADGPRTSAQFNGPRGIAIDANGNFYIADSGNYTVRKLAADGTVSTLAGLAGTPGSVDGVGSAARFMQPYGIGVDASGTVWVSDYLDHTIRKITPDGTVTTVAGSHLSPGFTDGTGTAAKFYAPGSIAVDSAGNVFIPDRSNHALRRMTPAGVVTTISGFSGIRGALDGAYNVARWYRPTGLAVNSAGTTVVVADTYNSTIRKVDTSLNVTTVAGVASSGSADGVRSGARFFTPNGLTFDASGNLIVADSYNHVIRKVTPAGVVSTIAGGAGVQGNVDGAASDARFRYPYGVAVDVAGNIYVADSTNQTIRKITPNGLVGTLAGLARTPGAVDGTGSTARFSGPTDLVMESSGSLLVTDSINHAIRRILPDGTVTTLAGTLGISGNSDGPALSARFTTPRGLAKDSAGNIYVADTGNHVIRKIAVSGNVSTIAGLAGTSGYVNGTGGTARFSLPIGLALDPDGNLLVGDSDNDVIRRVTPTGTVTTVGGLLVGGEDGIGSNASFWSAGALATDSAGNVYISDTTNNTIRKGGIVAPATATSRLSNLSVRANLIAEQRLITGFVVAGGTKNVLVRAVGPGLAPFLPGITIAGDPRLELYDSAVNLLQSNDDWGGSTTLSDAFNSVGAFGLPTDSKDAVILPSINGVRTAHVIARTTGIGLVEAYDTTPGTTARLINVSARSAVSPGAGALVAGFAIDGANQKTVLIRGVGPTLTAFGLTGVLTDPKIELYNAAQQKIAENDDWPASLETTFQQVNAFGFTAASKDAALLISLPPGTYTAQISGAGTGVGEGVIEVYEVGN